MSPPGDALQAAALAGPPGKRRFALTDSSGFVGRHLVGRLLRDGHAVRCLSRQAATQPGTEHRQLHNYLDLTPLIQALAGADVVIHLAARAHVLADTAASPEQAFREANCDSAVAVARATQAVGAQRLVLIRSIGVNGDHTGQRPFTADDAPAPAEPYAVSKWQAEQAVAALLAHGPTGLVVLRPALVYGADCPGNFARLMALVLRLPIVPLGGLHRPRSLIHIDNLCDAIVHAALHPAASGRTFLLSDGAALSVAELASTLAQAFGKPASRVWPVPESLLRMLAAAVGKRSAVDKIAHGLVVDACAFRLATGWVAPNSPAVGLAQTARGYLAARQA